MTWRYFKVEEFACPCCGEARISEAFVDRLDELRHRLGFPLPVTSGYRCPVHNMQVSTTGRDGPHTTGQAADLGVSGEQAYRVLAAAIAMGFSGIGVKQSGPVRFLHLDDLRMSDRHPRPRIWSY